MSNIHEPTKEELKTIAHGIADGKSVIDMAAHLGIDRSTLSGWMKRDGFLDTVAAAIDTPAELGVEAFENLFAEERQPGEREAAYFLRLDFADAVKEAHPFFFEALAEYERQQAERKKADMLNIETMVEMWDRNWKKGTADEKARGLKTAKQRRDYRCKHGIKWDCAGYGKYYEPTWDARRCKVEYSFEDGMLYEEQRKRFGYNWDDAQRKRLWELNGKPPPSDEARDALLPVTPAAAKELAEAVMAGADYFSTAREIAARTPARF